MKKMKIEINGEFKEVLVEKVAGHLWFHVDGETHMYTPETSMASGESGGAVEDPTKIQAPMPGKILKVLFGPGDKVGEGQTVVVMEAMKMEYNLKAAQDMVVDRIECNEGDTVGLGQLLGALKEADS